MSTVTAILLIILLFVAVAVVSVWFLATRLRVGQRLMVDIGAQLAEVLVHLDTDTKIEKDLAGILSASGEAALIVNGRSGVVTFANSHAYELFGYGGELIGMRVEDLMPESSRPHHVGLRNSFMDKPRTRQMGRMLKIYALSESGRLVRVQIGLNSWGTEMVIVYIRPIPDVEAIGSSPADDAIFGGGHA